MSTLVVDLPEPTRRDRWDIDRVGSVEAERMGHRAPTVWLNDRGFRPEDARLVAAALLAAADRAEQLAEGGAA